MQQNNDFDVAWSLMLEEMSTSVTIQKNLFMGCTGFTNFPDLGEYKPPSLSEWRELARIMRGDKY